MMLALRNRVAGEGFGGLAQCCLPRGAHRCSPVSIVRRPGLLDDAGAVALAQVQESERAGGETRGGRGLGAVTTPSVLPPSADHFRSHTWAGLPRGDQATLTFSISLGAHGAIFFSSPSLPPDVPRTPGRRQMARASYA
jgi:hypothetical protein